MKHLKKFNEVFYFGGDTKKARAWWDELDPEQQQELVEEHFPDKDFGALSMTDDEITKVFYLETETNEAKRGKLANQNEPTSVIAVGSDSITFDNGLILTSDHQQDCCEHHWVDFSYVNMSDFEGLKFLLVGESWFNRVIGYGIELVPQDGWGVRIPGYGSNNGYYSSDLSICLSDGRSFDISACQEIDG